MTILEDLKDILAYVYPEEERDYEEKYSNDDGEIIETKESKKHIFIKIKRVADWIESPACPLVDVEELE